MQTNEFANCPYNWFQFILYNYLGNWMSCLQISEPYLTFFLLDKMTSTLKKMQLWVKYGQTQTIES